MLKKSGTALYGLKECTDERAKSRIHEIVHEWLSDAVTAGGMTAGVTTGMTVGAGQASGESMEEGANESFTRSFDITSQNWNSDEYLRPEQVRRGEDEIVVGLYSSDGKPRAEFSVVWEWSGNKLEPYVDAGPDNGIQFCSIDSTLNDMLETVPGDASVKTVTAFLNGSGYIDGTQRGRPQSGASSAGTGTGSRGSSTGISSGRER